MPGFDTSINQPQVAAATLPAEVFERGRRAVLAMSPRDAR